MWNIEKAWNDDLFLFVQVYKSIVRRFDASRQHDAKDIKAGVSQIIRVRILFLKVVRFC